MRRSLSVLVFAGIVGSACVSSGPGSLQFGVQRLALDLAFVDEDASPPPAPEIIVRLVPAPPEVTAPDFDFSTIEVDPDVPPPPPPPLPEIDTCPTASPEETIELLASPSVIDPPVAGTYLRNNSGTITVTVAGALPLELPYPFLSTWVVSEPVEVERPGPLGTPSPGPARQFTIKKSLAPGFDTTETYEIGPEALLLIERLSLVNGIETKFRTDPPVEYFRYGAEGDDWSSAGADTENGFAVLFNGVISDREVVDVCGDLVDTFRIEWVEQEVNLGNAQTSGTDETQTTIVNIAPQYGGLVVREEFHRIQRTEAPDGSAVVVQFDYVSTITTVEDPLP